jgi:hypothetical protein
MRNPKTVKPPVAPHVYMGDGIPDHEGHDRCVRCRLAEARADVHTVPQASAAVINLEARRLGERGGA